MIALVDDAAFASSTSDSDEWRRVLTEGHRPLRIAHKIFKHLPSAPRCKVCHNPFGGVGGTVVGWFGFKPSRKNPNMCTACCDALPDGGATVDIAILFADVRGSTTIGERTDVGEYAALLNRFYKVATNVLVRHDAIIDKLIGDEVMALFVQGIAGPGYRKKSVTAAIELVHVVHRDVLPIGAAVHAGTAFVGNVGTSGVVDFTALGDPVNVTARLQGLAEDGEVIVTEELYRSVRPDRDGVEPRVLELRGRSEPVRAFSLRA
jgi:adenylate cyclase